MIEDNEHLHEIEYPESPNLDFEDANSFFIAGNEYEYDAVYLFIDRPTWNVDDNGSTYWNVRLKEGLNEYLGLRIPKEISDTIGFPEFDGFRSIIKINENPMRFFSKYGYTFISGHLAVK